MPARLGCILHGLILFGGASANVPLNVAGTVDAPLLYPTGGTIAGAALGTSAGAKVGGWVEGLFGKKDEKKPKKRDIMQSVY